MFIVEHIDIIVAIDEAEPGRRGAEQDHGGGQGGLGPNVNVDIATRPIPLPWSRRLFNGLAQVIVKFTRDAGEIRLTATAEGLKLATVTVQTQSCGRRPSVP